MAEATSQVQDPQGPAKKADRVIIPDGPFRVRELAPGLRIQWLYPGGIAGPNGEVFEEFPGGRTWSEIVMLGGQDDDFIYALPDIRLAPNQLWPMHWHDCWTVVVVLEGRCTMGDWEMEAGDVFIAAPSIEYGPLVIGTMGCRLLEIFADLELSAGGYGPEYHDHPTLQGGAYVFKPREGVNTRNEGNSSLPLDGVEGLWKTRLSPGATWYLGDRNRDECPVVRDTRLAAGEAMPGGERGDWYCALVLGGSVEISGVSLERDALVIAEPGTSVPAMTAGSQGAHILENFRTQRALQV